MRGWLRGLRDWWWYSGAEGAAMLAAAVGIMAGVTVGMMLVIAPLYALVGAPSCRAATAGLTLDSRWSFWGGCQVRTEALGWLPLENLRVSAGEGAAP